MTQMVEVAGSRKRVSWGIPPRPRKIVQLAGMLGRYTQLALNEEFQRDCRAYDKLDIRTPVGDRRKSKAFVNFTLKWNIYPIPCFLVNDENFLKFLEQACAKKGLIIQISPFSPKKQILDWHRQAKKKVGLIGGKRKSSLKISELRTALFYDYVSKHASFHHGFTAGTIAEALGNKRKRGRKIKRDKSRTYIELTNKELDRQERYLKKYLNQDMDYSSAERKATRQVTKLRWKEPKQAARLRMAMRRAIPILKKIIY